MKSRWLGQPTDVAMLDLLDVLGESDVRERLGARDEETPFSSERKWMGVVHSSQSDDEGAATPTSMAYMKGALGQVLKRCDTYIARDGQHVVLDDGRVGRDDVHEGEQQGRDPVAPENAEVGADGRED